MGYAFYERDGMKRGYSIACKCHFPGCKKRINRGLSYLCYGCTHYFCGTHLVCGETKFDCFAGESTQACDKCSDEGESDVA